MSVSEVQFAKRSWSHQSPFDSFACPAAHVAVRCPQPAGPRLMDQKGRCILAVTMNTVVSLG